MASTDPLVRPPSDARALVLNDLRGKCVATLALFAVTAVWLAAVPFGKAVVSTVANIGLPLLGCAWCLCLGRDLRGRLKAATADPAGDRTGFRRWTWLLLPVGIAIYDAGQIIYYYYDLVLARPPLPSPADICFFLQYLPIIAAVLLLPARPTGSGAARGRVLFDSLMTVTALATFSWYILLGPTLQSSTGSVLAKAINVGYLVFDLLVLFCVLHVSARLDARGHRHVVLPLCVGLLALTAADTVWGYRLHTGAYQIGEVVDAFWPLGLLLTGVAARAIRLAPLWAHDAPGIAATADPVRPVSRWRVLLPYALLPLTVALITYTYDQPGDAFLRYGVQVGAAVLLTLTLLRQWLAIHENAALNRSLARVNATLAASEERFRIAADCAGDMIYEWHVADGRLEWFGDIDRALGYPAGQFPRTLDAWTQAVHADDRARVLLELDAHLTGGRPFATEYRVVTLDGSCRYWSERGCAVRDAAGRPVRMVGAVSDITARKRTEEQLRHDSLHDALTGLPNRALFGDRVDRAVRRARDDGTFRFSVLSLDLDRFKMINDSLGHAAGDRLLTAVAGRLLQCVTGDAAATHTVARMGGDEFTLLVEGQADPAALAEQILARLAEPFAFDGHEIYTAGSIGIVPDGGGYESARDLLRDADAALYRAKAAGRGTYAVFDASMHLAAVARLQTESNLRRALDRGELLVHYQPIVSLQTREILGFEALVRWLHDGRMISPADFIPVAEDAGLIGAIGQWVLRESCRQLALWRAACPGRPDLYVTVNLSRRQLNDRSLPGSIRAAIDDAGIPAGSLKLEITESALMEDIDAAGAMLRQIKALGVRLVMDDFGTGYSSLSCLHRFPLDGLKIERSFVAHTTRRDYAAVIQAIITLARNLGIEVIAEGLETPEQVALLQALECGYAQGYYFSRPVPADDAGALLATGLSQTRLALTA